MSMFSSKSPSGESKNLHKLEIDDLGGFAAILRFPMPEVEHDDSEGEEDE